MNKETRHIYDRISDFFAASGLSKSAAKVFAWLTICEPAQQTAEQIQQATR